MDAAKYKIVEDDVLLRIFLSEREMLHGKPLYEAIVLKARETGLAGATVLRGVLGFGADKRMHAAKFIDLADNLPVVIEVVDNEETIALFTAYLDETVKDGFITMEKVHVVKYRSQ
ncbi:MAG: DUF190 domain-containing protein [Spirochaetales bacterium]|nr:DUF190 domain-containing protein [Spirochaetales bacterium]